MESALVRVSVIIAVYNGERFIRETIESVLNQDCDEFELLIVDDGSTDTTATIVQSYEDDRIRYIQQQNQGVCAARNCGLAIAKGEYVVFLDADDVLLPYKLRTQLAVFDAYRPGDKQLGIVNSGWRLIGEDGSFIAEVTPWENAPYLTLETWLMWKPVFPGALMLDRNEVIAAGGFDRGLKQAEDVDLVLRMTARGIRSRWLYQTTVLYRMHGENAILDVPQQARDISSVLDKFFAQWGVRRKKHRRLERAVRYNTLIWLVWKLFQNGYHEAVPAFLRKSVSVSPYRPLSVLSVVDWQVRLCEHALRSKTSLDMLRTCWPAMREAAALPDAQWEQVQSSLAFHLDLWQYATFSDVEKIAEYKELDSITMSSMAAPVVFVTHRTCHRDIAFFHQTLLDAGIMNNGSAKALSALYLLLASRSLYGFNLREFLICLRATCTTGISFAALKLWANVFRLAVRSLATGAIERDEQA